MNTLPHLSLRSLTTTLVFSVGLVSFLPAVETTPSRPNIIFLFSDDQTERAAGCYGNDEIITPNLDQLAREGVRFDNHYNTTAICMASRCNVLTGLYEYRHGCNFTHGDLEPRFIAQSYPVLLREAGYYTGFAGKVGFLIQGEEFDDMSRHFDEWAGGPGQTNYKTVENKGIARYADQYPHSSRAYGAWAQDFLKSAKQSGKPFCLSISFKAPHLPFTPDPIDLQRYEGKTFTPPANYGATNAQHLSPQARTSRAATGYREWINDYQNTVRRYYALISGVDSALGMIREGLVREGLSENTVIIYTSDNGYNSGSHGFGDKVLPYEEGSKSPLVIYDPRVPASQAGAVSGAITGNVDMAATIFALSNVPAPAAIDGKNLLPLLTNPDSDVREALPLFNFWGIASAQSMAVVSRDWKYIYWYYGDKGMSPTEELFHVDQDPIEMTQLAHSPAHSGHLNTMRQYYDVEVAAIQQRVISDHGYEPYPVLFDRQIKWPSKAPLLSQTKVPKPPRKIKQPKTKKKNP